MMQANGPKKLTMRYWLFSTLVAECLIVGIVLAITFQIAHVPRLLSVIILIFTLGSLVYAIAWFLEGRVHWPRQFEPDAIDHGELISLVQLKNTGQLRRIAGRIPDSSARNQNRGQMDAVSESERKTEPDRTKSGLDQLVNMKHRGVWLPRSD